MLLGTSLLPLFSRQRTEIAPGAVHVPGWLELDRQKTLVEACRAWATGPALMRHTRVGSGVMSVQTVCLGWHWLPYRYSRIAEDVDGAPVKPFPNGCATWSGARCSTPTATPSKQPLPTARMRR